MNNLSRQKRPPPDDEGREDVAMIPSSIGSSKRLRSTSSSLASISKRDDDESDSTWSKEDHRTLVQAIYDVGLKHSSPAVIQEHMIACNDQQLTGERLKSHLQKYRKNMAKNRDEFLSEYDSWLEKALAVGIISGLDDPPHPLIGNLHGSDGGPGYLLPPMAVSEAIGSRGVLGGEAPAFVTYSVLYERCAAADDQDEANQPRSVLNDFHRKPVMDASDSLPMSEPHQEFSIPILTDEERNSPLGVCFTRVVGLFRPMSLLLLNEREKSQPMTSSGEVNSRLD
jgi:SHAQKYF class myb-like DNA-binding protein